MISLLFASLIPSIALATSFSASVSPALIPILPSSTTAHLTTHGHHHTAPLSTLGHFQFRNLSSASYLLTIESPSYSFAPLRVDINAEATSEEPGEIQVWQTKHGIEWENKGVEMKTRPVEVQILGKKEFYQKREGFSPLSLLRNPMILLAVVSIGIMVGMPYLMENMDPEMKAEFQEQSKKSPLTGGGASALQNFDIAAWMAGSGTKSGETTAATTQETGRGGGGGGGGRRR